VLAGLSVIATLVGTVFASLSSRLYALGPVRNPLGTESVGDANPIVQPTIYTLALIATISLLGRLRYASEIERQQIKWFGYAGMVTIIGGLVYHSLFREIDLWWIWWAGFTIGAIGILSMPAAMGIAILRYYLYNIDLIINRTLVYGSITVLLSIFYFGSVTAFQYLFSLLTGQGNTPAIVVSTLGWVPNEFL
jgi:hypothetical protein